MTDEDLPDIVVIIDEPDPASIIVVEEVVEIIRITDAPPGPPGPAGDFDLEDLENAVRDYLEDNPVDIDAPDFTTYFENGLA